MFTKAHIAGVNVCSDEYHALKNGVERGDPKFVMSPSYLRAFALQPSKWIKGWNPKESKAKDWGNLVDCRTLTPNLFQSRYAITPETYMDVKMECPRCGTRTDSKSCRSCGVERVAKPREEPWDNRASKCSEWTEEQKKSGKQIVSSESLKHCDAAVKRLFEPVDGDDTIQRWFDCSERQVLVQGEWHDEPTGLIVPVSCLIDFVPRGDSEFADDLGDFKTCLSAHPDAFEWHAYKFGYHIQAAFDMDLFNIAANQQRSTWCFIAMENEEPWEFNRAIYGQDEGLENPSFVQLGRMESFGGYLGLMKLYCQCLKTGKWPSYREFGESVQGWSVLRPSFRVMQRAAAYRPWEAPVSEYAPEAEPEPILDGCH